ncbi:hypothetical protein HanRHA438_Chr15g0723141 [Helianthus annuus]|uniref:Uncharacterized protein n=1 Tax=Helianthus annuus TaxID=4232 RepID=A0A9K3H4F3_HELAN|nr:hypothetical protein HanXRQr2_Chr15g0710951 [Helianthus annuus]KAJ0457423.1 hypothetical protein HanIR_Chr15g0773601 [Helianthus annuus]KAJ0832751.1 hypothetical protein HanPSC8_Chr15g0682301 [Helianthus annuus]KAJ0846283.1 hypothetical protein HanRHA438_Chr15g0723141 [Helianthus annuus]
MNYIAHILVNRLHTKALRYGAGEEDVAGARPRGRRGRTGVTKGGPHALVRRKRLNSDGEDGTEGDGGAAAWDDGGDVAAPGWRTDPYRLA